MVMDQVVLKTLLNSTVGIVCFVLIKEITAEPLNRGINLLQLNTITWEAVTKTLPTHKNWVGAYDLY